MKKVLSILSTITLIGTSTASLVACNTPQEYTKEELEHLKKENQIDTTDETIKNNLELIAPQEKPFNQVDNKWYYVVWRGYDPGKWKFIKFKNNKKLNFNKIEIDKLPKFYLCLYKNDLYVFTTINTGGFEHPGWNWNINKNILFKYVYRWNLDTNEPDLILDENGNIKIK